MGRRKKASEAFDDFFGYYQQNKHYLPKKLSDMIGKLCSQYKKLFVDFTYDARMLGEKTDRKKWGNLVDVYEKDLSKNRDLVADEFRKMIGVK